MELNHRTVLRLHVEAVWGVCLPRHMTGTDIELLPHSPQPDWRLLLAEQPSGPPIRIWRWPLPDTVAQASLFWRAASTLALPLTTPVDEGLQREIAFALPVPLAADIVSRAQSVARPLTMDDQQQVEAFQAGSSAYYFDPVRSPLIGVIEHDRLVCIAHSSRHTLEACELGIETLPEARRRGYAWAATVLWTASVSALGLVPLYSALAENSASLRLAASVGYRMFTRAATVAPDD